MLNNKYRVVTDNDKGFGVDVKRWWLPIWLRSGGVGVPDSFRSETAALRFISEKRTPKFKSKVIKEIL